MSDSVQPQCSTPTPSSSSGDGRLRPVVLPKIVNFAYINFTETIDRRTASCKTCKSKISDKSGTTSNFVRHVKTNHAEQ